MAAPKFSVTEVSARVTALVDSALVHFPKPELPFVVDALAKKGISQATIEYHYGKHHLGYWRKLNAYVEGLDAPEKREMTKKSLEELIKSSEGKVFNLAAQIWNHSFYWESLSGASDGLALVEGSDLSKRIIKDFESFDGLKDAFTRAAAGHFGSGWVWLCYDQSSKQLIITEGHDAANPLTEGKVPLLTIDVWEHAYYIDQRNDRAAYIAVWWNCVDWNVVEKRFAGL